MFYDLNRSFQKKLYLREIQVWFYGIFDQIFLNLISFIVGNIVKVGGYHECSAKITHILFIEQILTPQQNSWKGLTSFGHVQNFCCKSCKCIRAAKEPSPSTSGKWAGTVPLLATLCMTVMN